MASEKVGVPAPPAQSKIYLVLMVGGFLIVISALGVMAMVATVAAGVFDFPKGARDAAEAGSPLLANQGDLFVFPLWVTPLIFVGITFLWVGIITVLWAIRRTIREALAPSMREGIPQLLQRRRPNQPTKQEEGGDGHA